MSKLFFSVEMSLDGFIAGQNGRPNNPLGDNWTKIHECIYRQKAFRETQNLRDGGETGPNNDLQNEINIRIGANIMGKRMFEEGEPNWPEDLFKTDVFAITHEKREAWVQNGSTSYHFTDENIERVLEKACKSAGEKDIRISGGASTLQQFLNA